jgi:Mg-chelatase subunit ChlD
MQILTIQRQEKKMRNESLVVLILLLLAVGLVSMGCGDDSSNANGDDGNGGDSDVDGDADGDADSDADSDGDFVACETLSSDLNRVGTRVMLLEDKSSSMSDNNKWTLAVAAIDEMVTAYESDIEFGLDLFPAGGNSAQRCEVGDSVLLDVTMNNASSINSTLANTALNTSTPLLSAMLNYTDDSYAPTFLDGSGGSYLVIVSDGGDSCGRSGVLGGGASAAELGDAATQLRERGIRTIVIGFGEGAEPNQLNAIAAAGGTVFDTYLQADDGEELKDALSQIAEKVVVSCEFQVGAFENPDVNYDWVIVTFDGVQIPRNDGCRTGEGWTWMNDAHSTIEFCNDSCAKLESGNVGGIKVQLACDADDVLIVDVE